MRNKIFDEHRRLVKTGKYRKARRLLQMLATKEWETMLCKKSGGEGGRICVTG